MQDPLRDVLRTAMQNLAPEPVPAKEGEDFHGRGQRIALSAGQQPYRLRDAQTAIRKIPLFEKPFGTASAHVDYVFRNAAHKGFNILDKRLLSGVLRHFGVKERG